MLGKKRILIACGITTATSRVVPKGIEEILYKLGIQVIIEQCKASEISSLSINTDLNVMIMPVNTNKDVLIIQMLAFLTVIGKFTVIEQIVEKLLAYPSTLTPSYAL